MNDIHGTAPPPSLIVKNPTAGREAPQRNVDPTILKAAQGMESMFLDFMMKTMRKTVPDNPMALENNATKIYQSMLDSEAAENAAKAGGIGLADLIVAYYDRAGYNLNRKSRFSESVSSDVGTGGTDEDQSIARPSQPGKSNRVDSEVSSSGKEK